MVFENAEVRGTRFLSVYSAFVPRHEYFQFDMKFSMTSNCGADGRPRRGNAQHLPQCSLYRDRRREASKTGRVRPGGTVDGWKIPCATPPPLTQCRVSRLTRHPLPGPTGWVALSKAGKFRVPLASCQCYGSLSSARADTSRGVVELNSIMAKGKSPDRAML